MRKRNEKKLFWEGEKSITEQWVLDSRLRTMLIDCDLHGKISPKLKCYKCKHRKF